MAHAAQAMALLLKPVVRAVCGTPDAWYNRGYILPWDRVLQTNYQRSTEIHSAIPALDVARAIIKQY